jgi:hypothetical protein
VEYQTPSIIDYGDLVDLTAGQQAGQFTDASFPANTPASQLTFSG